ncbi:MAG: hypothetical protein IT308_05945 [Anaerolineaceae bacterium]|nr:hypothetical protein [Anaerolineaceae bacterium]
MSQLFTQTRREAPSESDWQHHRLLLRAGYLGVLEGGSFALLPLGLRAIRKMLTAVEPALHTLNALEVYLPSLEPSSLRQSAGDPHVSQDAALWELAHTHLRSYRQLPILLYHLHEIWGVVPAGGGLLRSRSAYTLEITTLHATPADQKIVHQKLQNTLASLFDLLALPVLAAEAAPPSPAGESRAWQWFIPLAGASGKALACAGCGTVAVQASARFRREENTSETPLPLEKVATPDCPTIESLAAFLNIPASRTAKAVLLMARHNQPGNTPMEELIFCVVRGDRSLNETALLRLLNAASLRPALDAEIRQAGAVPGYASPVGLQGVRVIVDSEIPASPNLVSGANEAGCHLLNVNYGRDYQATQVAEIALAAPGDVCETCGKTLQAVDGVPCGEMVLVDPQEAGETGSTFRDENGQTQTALLGKYSLNLTRLLACTAELHHDGYGLKLPLTTAPYPIHLVMLASKEGGTEKISEELYHSLTAAGLEPLFDDRAESPGVKFNDADLIGLPLRITIGERGLQKGGVEYKKRLDSKSGLLPLEGFVDHVRNLVG